MGTARALAPLAASFLCCALDRFSLTKPNTFPTIDMPASLHSDGVRVHPGVPFGFAGILNGASQPSHFGSIGAQNGRAPFPSVLRAGDKALRSSKETVQIEINARRGAMRSE
jgi:hypothetical protein